jgi:hypothetical protein
VRLGDVRLGVGRVLEGRERVAPRGEDEAIVGRLPSVLTRSPLIARCVALLGTPADA